MRRRLPIFITLALTLVAAAAWWIYSLDKSLQNRLSQGWFLPPIEYYSRGIDFRHGSNVDLEKLKARLTTRGFRLRDNSSPLRDNDFTLLPPEGCEDLVKDKIPSAITQCLAIRSSNDWSVIGVDSASNVVELWKGAAFTPVSSLSIAPSLIAQFYQGQPLYKEPVELPAVPLACLEAVTAIEDNEFLRHHGVSFGGIGRAMYRNILKLHWAEGGSTITQQLVKNYFLSPKKTIRRKITEQILSLLLESRVNKDTILEQYLNVIFMGVAGPYQIRGFASASRYYFGKPISDLGLPECSLLAAMVNSPGRYSPFEHPENARKRRELVLKKMTALELITQKEMDTALAQPLPTKAGLETQAPAPYFLQSVQRELDQMNLAYEKGLRVITAFNSDYQDAANQSVRERIKELDKTVKPGSPPLQTALITVDLETRHVTALVGGRSFQQTQFNRINDGIRQIGSEAKPFVYLTAMSTLDPLTEVVDEPFEYKYGKQTWTPKNYDNKYRGKVPLFLALAESLNVPAAKTAIQAGVPKIAENFRKAGVEKEIPEVPSLALGTVELSPWDLAQAYSTLANFGEFEKIHTIVRVETLDGTPIWDERSLAKEPRLDPAKSAEVVGMMISTVTLGTAQNLKTYQIPQPIAAKTGTTNDLKDAWFVGFTPQELTIVWVGFDNGNQPVGTGAMMALPIWGSFHQKIAPSLGNEDFKWPDSVELRRVSMGYLASKYSCLEKTAAKAAAISLVFEKGR